MPLVQPPVKSKTDRQQILIVAGMHRSGTSLVASLLHHSGIFMGERFIGPEPGNPLGHFEDADIVQFHESVLAAQGLSPEGYMTGIDVEVPDVFVPRARELINSRTSPPVWGWKDPRTTLFLNFWADLLPNANFLFVLRAPWDVIESLFRRGDAAVVKNPSLALELWQHYNQKLYDFQYRNPGRCMVIDIGQVTASAAHFIRLTAERFGLELAPPPDTIYKKDLFHKALGKCDTPTLVRQFFPNAIDMYARLSQLTPEKSQTVFRSAADIHAMANRPVGETILSLWCQNLRLQVENQKQLSTIDRLQGELEHALKKIRTNDSSWPHMDSTGYGPEKSSSVTKTQDTGK